jgi:predicted nucleic acid-binding protein
MPAIEQTFSGAVVPPARLYVDTDILVAAIVRTHHHHTRSRTLLELLITYGLTRPYLCPISWMEFLRVFSREDVRRALPSEFAHLRPVSGWLDASLRATYYAFVMALFRDLLAPFDWEEVLLTDAVQERAVQLMAEYNFDSQDAVHLACADLSGIRDFASFDRRFRRVDGLHLWNDQIYGAR